MQLTTPDPFDFAASMSQEIFNCRAFQAHSRSQLDWREFVNI